jgi:hypothetical protein
MTERVIIWAAVSTVGQADEEKFSMDAQVNDATALCERNGWQIVDIIRINGHSRNYRTLAQLAAAGRAHDEPGFDKLIAHLTACDFTILIARDANRFARKASLLYEIVDMILEDCGARIYSLADGWVDSSNADMWLMVKGFEVRKQMNWITKEMARGRHKLVDERGLPASSKNVWSHMRVRDERGKAVALVPDPSKQHIIADAARLVLERIRWDHIERELFNRFGHGVDGKPFTRQFFYLLFYSPWFWGHAARNHFNIASPNKRKLGSWAFDASEPVPEGVTLNRDINPPALTGELAAQLRGELARRLSYRPNNHYRTHRFSGLLICDHCRYAYVWAGSKSRGYNCESKFRITATTRCPRKWYINENRVEAWITPYLVEMLRRQQPDLLAHGSDAPDTGRIAAVEADITKVEGQIKRLISKQATAPDNLADLYDEQLAGLSRQLDALRRALAEAQRVASQFDLADVTTAFHELEVYGTVEALWAADGGTVNQLLHRLMGKRRMVVRDGQIIGTITAPRR